MTTIFLITGFLGAGKTTFLKGRLAATSGRTGVLVNDFGKVNFDGLQIQREGLSMVELSNGSIFCSCLKDNFIEGLVDLIQQGLDTVFIESSGLADPSEMGKILGIVRLRTTGTSFRFGGTICLVDALFFPKVLPKMLSVERQIRHSHLILVNKRDLIDAAQLGHVLETLAVMNPKARLIETEYGQVDPAELAIEAFEIADEETTNKLETRNKNLVLHLLYEPEVDAFRAFLDAISNYFFRIKGFIRLKGQLVQVDQVNQQISFQTLSADQVPPDQAGINQLVCLTSQGLESISHLARMADQYIPGHFRLEM